MIRRFIQSYRTDRADLGRDKGRKFTIAGLIESNLQTQDNNWITIDVIDCLSKGA